MSSSGDESYADVVVVQAALAMYVALCDVGEIYLVADNTDIDPNQNSKKMATREKYFLTDN